MAGLVPAITFAQAPPPVPALPDTQRLTTYSINAATGPYSVGFALYGDSTDYGDWLEVRLCTSAVLNPCSALTAVTQWTLSSATGAIATIPRPITDATITLTSPMTGTLLINGARRPRRTAQFAENRGVAARDLNQAITDITAQNRETWDRVGRTIRGQPNEAISPLQPATTRAGGVLCWDGTGLIPLTCAAGSSGTANVVGPNVAVIGHIATFGNTLGTILTDGGLVGAGNMTGPVSSTVNHAATFKDSLGVNIIDSGLTLTPSTGTLTLTNAKTLAATNSLTLSGTDGTTMTFPGTSATIARTDAANTFIGHQTIEGVTSAGATGTGNLVFATAPTLGLTTVSSLILSTGLIYPLSDSTTALQISQASGVSPFVTFDSTNKRVGINKTPGAFDLDVNGSANVGATLAFGTLDAASLGSSTSTITGLSTNNSPTPSADYLLYFSASDNRIRKATVAAIAAAATAGVSTLNGLTGGLSIAVSGATNLAASGSTVTLATPDHFFAQNCTLAASVGSNILTVAVKDNSGADPSATSPCRIPFRSVTPATGSSVIDSVTGALSITTNATGATLGSSNSTAFRFWVVAFDNGGTVVLALINCSNGTTIFPLNEGVIQTTVAMSSGATSAGVFYTPNGTTLTSKAFKILGYVEYNATGLVTAGTYASGPNFIQTFGPGIRKPGEPVQIASGSTTSVATTTSATFAALASSQSVSITPTSAVNLIRAYSTGGAGITTGTNAFVQFARAGSLIGNPTAISPASALNMSLTLSVMDFPNSISSLAYTYQGKTGAGTLSYPIANTGVYMELQEIMG